tara:strand:- start:2379 stop:3581 length:1203 start_codon:yes stop_codon:yes gene_type:complete
MVSTFTQPDYTAQGGTAYKTNLDAAAAIFKRMAAAFAPHAQSTPNMTIRLDAGVTWDGDITLTEVAAQNTGTITAPSVNPRIDRVVVEASSGSLTVITGSEAASPTAPAITTGNIPVCQVALTTSTTEIANADITDERIGFYGTTGGTTEPFAPRGLKCSLDSGTPDEDLNIAAGGTMDATNTKSMTLASEITKQNTGTWVVGDDQGGLDTGTVAASTLYAIWLIKRSDTDVVDVLISLSFTSPTMPTSYDYKRLIGAVVTDSSSDFIPFAHSGIYFRFLGDVITDITDSSITHNTFETGTLSVPPFSVADVYAHSENDSGATGEGNLVIKTKGAADVVGRVEAFIAINAGGWTPSQMTGSGSVMVDINSQVEYAAAEGMASTNIVISTMGFTMHSRSNP